MEVWIAIIAALLANRSTTQKESCAQGSPGRDHKSQRVLISAAVSPAIVEVRRRYRRHFQRDGKGNPTGLLIARPNATILYATLAKGPKLPPEHQLNSTRHFMRELNRLGLTSIIGAGGGFQNYPEDYSVIEELHKRGEMTLPIAYNLFTQKPKQEKEDFARWIKMTGPGKGDAPPPIPVLPEWSPVRVFGGYGAPLDVRKAVRAGVPVAHQHSAECHQPGCAVARINSSRGSKPHATVTQDPSAWAATVSRFEQGSTASWASCERIRSRLFHHSPRAMDGKAGN